MHDQVYYLSIPLLLIGYFAVGRSIGISGFFPAQIGGLVVYATPIAIIANFNGELASALISSTPLMLAVFNFIFYLNFLRSYRFNKEPAIQQGFTILGTLVLIIFVLFWRSEYVSSEAYLFDSHDYYFAAIPLELLVADYPSRLRIYFAYPFEWARYYFLQGTALALLLSLFEGANFFSVKLGKYLLGICSIMGALELIMARDSKFAEFKFSERKQYFNSRLIRFCLALMLCVCVGTIYNFAFQWGTNANSFLSFGSAMFFSISRINGKRRESHIWLLILALSSLRNLPVCLVALCIIYLSDCYSGFGLNDKSKMNLLHLKSALKSLTRSSYCLTMLCLLTFAYTVSTFLGKPASTTTKLIDMGFAFPSAWWILLPEFSFLIETIKSISNSFSNFALNMKLNVISEVLINYTNDGLNKKLEILVPLLLLAGALLPNFSNLTSKDTHAFRVLGLTVFVFSFIFAAPIYAPVASVFSFVWLPLILFTLSQSVVRVVISGLIFVFLLITGILQLAPPLPSIIKTPTAGYESQINDGLLIDVVERKNPELQSLFQSEEPSIICKNTLPKFNEAWGGEFGLRVAYTSANLEKFEEIRNDIMVLRHISLFTEETLRDEVKFKSEVDLYACDS